MIIALDYGERYVGVAITDPEGRLALRHAVIDQKKENARELIGEIVLKEKVTTVLVGVPVSLEGEETEQTHVSLRFIEQLQEALGEGVAVVSVNETLTSAEAERRIAREGGSLHEAHAEAARIMLEEYLRPPLS